jgi:hypothetical protein
VLASITVKLDPLYLQKPEAARISGYQHPKWPLSFQTPEAANPLILHNHTSPPHHKSQNGFVRWSPVSASDHSSPIAQWKIEACSLTVSLDAVVSKISGMSCPCLRFVANHFLWVLHNHQRALTLTLQIHLSNSQLPSEKLALHHPPEMVPRPSRNSHRSNTHRTASLMNDHNRPPLAKGC